MYALSVFSVIAIAIIVLVIWLIVKIVRAVRTHFERVAQIESTLVVISDQLDRMSRERSD
jgi:uncharacterized protein YoxC